MQCLNGDISSPSKYHPICEIEKGEYKEWSCSDCPIYMDINTLELCKGDLSEVPDPANVAPQHRFSGNTQVKALCLNVTHACQLRCKYCYLSHFYPEMEIMMTPEIATKAVDVYIPENSKNIKVTFFGGEALLNFHVVKHTVKYINDKFADASKKFSMTTNGVAITPAVAAFLKENNFSLIVSMDGPEKLHNENRVYGNQKDSYSDVMKGLKLLKIAGVKRITLRGTFLPTGKGTLLERVKHLNELCDKGYASSVSIEPACLSESCSSIADEMKFTVGHVKEMRKEYQDVAEWMVQRYKDKLPVSFHNIKVYIDRLVNKKQYSTQCSAGMGVVTISPDGEVFACHREMSSHIGSMAKGGIDEAERAKWVDNRYYSNPACSACNIRNICGGPCREHNITTNGDIRKNDPVSCAFYHNWIEAAVYIVDKVGYEALKDLYKDVIRVNRYSFVREGGGFGDIISMGGAVIQKKLEDPRSIITLCVPNEFVPIAKHLQGVDKVTGLGPLKYLVANRRSRSEKFVKDKYSYLLTVPEGTVVDMWGPGFLYETSRKEGPLDLTRSQIFAKEAGCKDLTKALPSWQVSKDDREFIKGCFDTLYTSEKTVVALAPRGTDPSRSLPMELIEEILDWLHEYSILYLDCQMPQFTRSHANTDIPKNMKFVDSVALAEQCDILISVDTAMLHAGAGLRIPTVGIFTMTDPAPYEKLYPTLWTASPKERTSRCAIPCNRSAHKGYSALCHEGKCLRKEDLTLDMIIPAFALALELSMRPSYQKYRVRKMLC